MRIVLLGTRGVPARYGGFETAVEEVGWRLAERGHDVVVYCRNRGQDVRRYRGMRLVNLPALRIRSAETLAHTALSVAHAIVRVRPDVAVVFNAGNAPLLPVLRAARVPTILHLDGLEWKRAKWEGFGQRYYRWAEAASVRGADLTIADAKAIAAYVEREYGKKSVYVPYGAPLILPGHDRLAELELEPGAYHLVVARWEPENHIHIIIEGYRKSGAVHPLVVVGSSPYSRDYNARVVDEVREDPRIRLIGAVWDQTVLDQLYANCLSYLHGHSVGGTNPSLLRAMGAGAPVSAYDVDFNHEVTGGHARFFSTWGDVTHAIEADEKDSDATVRRGAAGRQRASEAYTWEAVTDDYERLCEELAVRRRTARG